MLEGSKMPNRTSKRYTEYRGFKIDAYHDGYLAGMAKARGVSISTLLRKIISDVVDEDINHKKEQRQETYEKAGKDITS